MKTNPPSPTWKLGRWGRGSMGLQLGIKDHGSLTYLMYIEGILNNFESF